jgi:hypothetical protein
MNEGPYHESLVFAFVDMNIIHAMMMAVAATVKTCMILDMCSPLRNLPSQFSIQIEREHCADYT